MIKIGETCYREAETLIIAAPIGESWNPPDGHRAPCPSCGAMLSFDDRNGPLVREGVVWISCLRCAIAHHPQVRIHLANGLIMTLGEAVDRGIVTPPGV
jgi:hypothetical protein